MLASTLSVFFSQTCAVPIIVAAGVLLKPCRTFLSARGEARHGNSDVCGGITKAMVKWSHNWDVMQSPIQSGT